MKDEFSPRLSCCRSQAFSVDDALSDGLGHIRGNAFSKGRMMTTFSSKWALQHCEEYDFALGARIQLPSTDCTSQVFCPPLSRSGNRNWVSHSALGLILLFFGSLTAHAEETQLVSKTEKHFRIFDAMFYKNKPDLSKFGVEPISGVYAGAFGSQWYKDAKTLPQKESVQEAARRARREAGIAFLDIEHWPLKGDGQVVEENVRRYSTVAQWFREVAPGFSFGYYGVPPLRDYWRAVKSPASTDRRSWMEENDRLIALAAVVDVFFPSLYTFYDDQVGWRQYAIAQIAETRRYAGRKPVYVFLWPQFHDSNRRLKGTYLSRDFWKLELETAHEFADGVVIWGGGRGWDEQAPWWEVTKSFLARRSQSKAD